MQPMEYLIILTPDDDSIQVTIPDLPNVLVCGRDEADATQRAREAIDSYLEELRRMGIPAPVPSAKPVMIDAA